MAAPVTSAGMGWETDEHAGMSHKAMWTGHALETWPSLLSAPVPACAQMVGISVYSQLPWASLLLGCHLLI